MADSRFKIFSDPVHGFISVPKNLILDLIQTPQVQRLRRIRQLGVGHLVFPGAEHTRFGHALGAMALMHDALASLSEKGTEITPDEYTAALAAALLHDIGHGPFSHTLEHELIEGFAHEAMSRVFLTRLNERFHGALDLAIAIFDDAYPRPFFHQLVSSQLDMDRLDYLRRDSFFTGVVEGRVGVERIIKTLRVHPLDGGPDAEIVIESKGIYAAENFILARRLMYWQVYLHKTVLAGDQLLRAILRRVRQRLLADGLDLGGSEALLFFLRRTVRHDQIDRPDVVQAFAALDDTDILFSLKQWMRSTDPILADLARRFIERDFFRVTFLPEPPSAELLDAWRGHIADWLVRQGLASPSQAAAEAAFYLILDRSHHAAYERAEAGIRVLGRDGVVRELSESTDTSAIATQTHSVIKPYVCYPRDAALADVLPTR
ncbi:HD family phosphohydrolase [Rhodothermaceae bacterium RA]|nr:HD family phosphohydrolase [Rhodothermaceae bacterium RA]